MTYVQYINCSKWKKIIGISLWVGATIGLGFVMYELINFPFDKIITITTREFDTKTMGFVYTTKPDYATASFIVGITGLANIVNVFMIWRTLNNHYRWLEIKCGVKPIPKGVEQ